MVVSGQSQALAALAPVPISHEGVPESNSGRFEEQKYLLLLPRFEPRTLQSFACSLSIYFFICDLFNRLTPNDPYMGRTAPLTSKRCILYI
jgi:hypothetical protein